MYLIGPLPWKCGSVPRFNWFQLRVKAPFRGQSQSRGPCGGVWVSGAPGIPAIQHWGAAQQLTASIWADGLTVGQSHAESYGLYVIPIIP